MCGVPLLPRGIEVFYPLYFIDCILNVYIDEFILLNWIFSLNQRITESNSYMVTSSFQY